ncbi:MAG: hypothetical protein H7326_00250 [Bdellovibrionaceae bacterium]|nr:hypothetical protein [Pseudobdellovibrionaceae bacterium]
MENSRCMSFLKLSLAGIACFISVSTASAGFYSNDFNSLVAALKVAGVSPEGLWQFQDPKLGKNEFTLPKKSAPWAGNYSPMMDGGIASRWQQGTYATPDTMPTRETAKRMTSKEIAKLSPSEKMDLLNGDYEYKITNHELYVRGPYRTLTPEFWEGFCNGVRCAGFLTPEPTRAIVMTNPDGIQIRFEPADLKALAGASFFYVQDENYVDIGKPSRGDERGSSRPNFGVVYLTLKFYLAEMQKAFVVDMSLDSQLWNETAAGYSLKQSDELQLTKAESLRYAGAVSKRFVKIRLKTLGEVSMDQSNRATKKSISKGEFLKETPMSGFIFLNKDGMIMDGDWRDVKNASAADFMRGIDFMWFSSGRGADADFHPDNKDPNFSGTGNKYLDFEKVLNLMQAASTPKKCSGVFGK